MLFRRVPVRGLADDLPEDLVIDVTPLEIGDNKRVSDIEVPNCTVLLNDSTLLVAVKRTHVLPCLLKAVKKATKVEMQLKHQQKVVRAAKAVTLQQLNNYVSPAAIQPKTDEVPHRWPGQSRK